MTERGLILAGRLFDGTGAPARTDMAVIVEGGLIANLCAAADAPDLPVIARADVVTPGLVDLQINGGGGVLFNDSPDVAGLARMAEGLRRGGTCWFLPTFITDEGRRYEAAIAAARAAQSAVPGVVGLHLEGPFLSPARPGIHPAQAIRPMDGADVAAIIGAGLPLLLTLAPEEAAPGLVRQLSDAGVTVFAGHTEASAEDITRAEAEGLRGATHLFNAMSQMQGRAPGTVGAVLASDKLAAGIIPDGIHVHPASLRAALAAMGPERLFLVSDAMSPQGTDMTSFTLLGKEIFRKDGRLTDAGGTLAGADISMAACVARMVELTGIDLAQAVRMATLTPARVMGLEGSIGSIAPGKRAGLTLLSDALEPSGVVVDGVLA